MFYHIRIENKVWIESKDKSYNKYLHENIEKKTEEVKQYDCNKLLKMKLTELQKMAADLNIQIKKLNPRKTRMINKKKDELIADIIKTN